MNDTSSRALIAPRNNGDSPVTSVLFLGLHCGSSRSLRGLHFFCLLTRNSPKNKRLKQQEDNLLRAYPPGAAVGALFPARTALQKMRVPALVCVLACLCAAAGPVAGADRSCTDLRQFYASKGFTLSGVPQTEISGRCERNSLNWPVLPQKPD